MVTTIQLKNETLDRLKYFKAYSKESYDETINKLLDTMEEGELTPDAIRDIQSSLDGINAKKGKPLEQVAKEMGIKL